MDLPVGQPALAAIQIQQAIRRLVSRKKGPVRLVVAVMPPVG
jgi:hypothetical protein